ncbi:MAG: MarR family winged helix-turn-helix transcriptional regulator [Eubacteriales bacterium]|jgi:MarR family transcriptional repressor of mepA
MQRHVGRELRLLNNLIMRHVDSQKSLREIQRLTGTNGWIIGYIEEHGDEPVYQKNLEMEFGITRSTASKVVNLMVQKGFLRRESVSHDARLKRLRLTEQATAVSQQLRQCREEFEKTLMKGFSPKEEKQLLAFIDRMKYNMETANEE